MGDSLGRKINLGMNSRKVKIIWEEPEKLVAEVTEPSTPTTSFTCIQPLIPSLIARGGGGVLTILRRFEGVIFFNSSGEQFPLLD